MLGKPNQLQPKLFYSSFSLEQRVHEDHPLRKIKNLIDFSFIRSEVEELYGYNGNQGTDPAVILKLMFLLFYENVKAVDDKHGIITATITTAANIRDDKVFKNVLEENVSNTKIKPLTAVADTGYSYENNFEYLHDNDIQSCIAQRGFGNITCQDFSRDHFIYDVNNDCFVCPAGQKLARLTLAQYDEVVKYRAEREICQNCEYVSKCLRSTKNGRIVSRKIGIDYRQWAYNCLCKEKRLRLLSRRKHKIEGSFADAANNHGFKRIRFRGIEKATIQNFMIAAIQNLRKFIKFNTLKPAVSIANPSEYSVFKELFQLFWFKLLFL